MSKRISKTVKTHHGALKMLAKARGENYKNILTNTPKMVTAIKMVCRHILNGNFKLGRTHIKKLKPLRQFIRKIAYKPHRAIKVALQTGGNIIQSILNSVLPLLPALL